MAPAALDSEGKSVDFTQMEEQVRQTYRNALELLAFPAQLVEVTFRAVLPDSPALL